MERWRLAGWPGGVSPPGYQRMLRVWPVGGGTPPSQPARRQRSNTMTRGKRIAVLVFAAWIAHDLLVPPRYALDARMTLAAIDEYRSLVSPHLRGLVECRFTPTCSWYGHESIRKHGFLIGGAKTFWRIARCGPWTKLGTNDPP